VYALGVIWYQMLVGDVTKERPGGSSWKKRLLDQGTTPDMLALLERCLEDDPADRPADAQVLAQELQAIVMEATTPTVEPLTPGPPPLPPAPPPVPADVKEAGAPSVGPFPPVLTVLAEPKSGSKKDTKRLVKAKRLVRKPAIALMVTGTLILVASLGLMPIVFRDSIALLPLMAAVAAGVAFFSGFSMMQLRRYQLCIVGSIAVMPFVVFLPIGISALATLRLPGMRAAFRLNEERRHEESIAALDDM
jgi:hypothetical protein